MSKACVHCDALTIWDDTVGSSVCTSCGSLVDPSQSVLTSRSEGTSLWHESTTLKSLRSRNNWDLSGQGKETRDRRQAAASADLINSLAASFHVPGLAPRAITLFNQVKDISDFRWGNRSRSTAAACFAIALRESGRPDAIRDIASILDIPPTTVTREFSHITASLGLSLTLIDPSGYMPTLQAHLSSLQSNLPTSLSKPLEKLNLHSVKETAISLSRLLVRLSPGHDVLRLPVPPTACAIFILALEGVLRAPLNPLGDMAKCLGGRFHVAKGIVMVRYKIIQDEIASWAENLPWLDRYESKGGRAKVSKRVVVARGLGDVILFQEDIWQNNSKFSIPSELFMEDDDSEEVHETRTVLPSSNGPKPNPVVARSIQFLLDPVGTPVPPLPASASHQLSLATYLLTTPSASVSNRLPTRLQLLTSLRGGSSEDRIRDDELFAAGELDNLFRNEDEVHILRETLGWGSDTLEEPPSDCNHDRKRNISDALEGTPESEVRIATGAAFQPRRTRLNVEALAQIISENHTSNDADQFTGLDEVMDEIGVDDTELSHEDNLTCYASSKHPKCAIDQSATSFVLRSSAEEVGEVIFAEWRPPSPGSGVAYGDSRYEEDRPP